MTARPPLVSLFFGAFACAMLYGVTCIQTFIFYQKSYRHQHLLLKIVVPVLWVLDTLQMAFLMHVLFWFTIENYGNPVSSSVEPWSLYANVLVSAVCGAIVRSVFAQRVFILSGRRLYLIIPLCGLIITILVLGLLFCIKGFLTKTFIETPEMDKLIIPLATLSVIGDIYIAGTLCYFVHTRRSKLNKHTDSMLRLVMIYTINNGAITSLTSITCLLAFIFISYTGVPFALYFLLSKLYVNCLLAGLNARDHLRNKANHASVDTPASPILLSTPNAFANPLQSMDTCASSQLRTPEDGQWSLPHSHRHHHHRNITDLDLESGKHALELEQISRHKTPSIPLSLPRSRSHSYSYSDRRVVRQHSDSESESTEGTETETETDGSSRRQSLQLSRYHSCGDERVNE